MPAAVPHFSMYHIFQGTVLLRFKMFSLWFVFVGFFMFYLCEKYKSIPAQYYVVDFASWVLRVNLLDLKTN